MTFNYQKNIQSLSFTSHKKLAFILILCLLCKLSNQNQHSNHLIQIQQDIGQISSNQNLDNTFHKSKYNFFVTPKKNKIWAGALSLAWNQLKNNIIKQDIKLNTKNDTVLSIIQNFNEERFTKNDLQESSYYVKSGYGPKTLQEINNEIKIKFLNKTIEDVQIHLNEQDIISYSYLFKEFQFNFAFQKLSNFQFKNMNLNGIHHITPEQTDQLYYYFYENEASFLFGIDTKNQNQEVLFLKTDKNYIIDDVLVTINRYGESKKNKFTRFDKFIMPIIKFDLRRSLKELQGLNFLNPSMKSYTLTKVFQAVKLNIDEKGVKVQNLAQMVVARSLPLHKQKFILDNTFWVILKQKNKHPYLIMQINSPEQVINLE